MDAERLRLFSIKPIVGAFLVFVGSLATLDNLGIIDADPILRWWSVVLVAIGIVLASRGRWIAGLVWTLIGVWILGWNLGFVEWSITDLWPLILIGIGVVFVRQGMAPRRTGESDSASTVDMLGCWFSNQRSSTSPDFRGGSMTAIMGGAALDLTAADIRDEEATIDVFAFWGGIEIRVPRTWSVVGQVTPLMGGFDDKSQPAAENRKRLVVRGFVLMGGVEVKN